MVRPKWPLSLPARLGRFLCRVWTALKAQGAACMATLAGRHGGGSRQRRQPAGGPKTFCDPTSRSTPSHTFVPFSLSRAQAAAAAGRAAANAARTAGMTQGTSHTCRRHLSEESRICVLKVFAPSLRQSQRGGQLPSFLQTWPQRKRCQVECRRCSQISWDVEACEQMGES